MLNLSCQRIGRRSFLRLGALGGACMPGLLEARTLLSQNPKLVKDRAVIFLFMHGGPSHVDLFDYKPQLIKDSGKPLPFPERKVQFAARGNLMASPWQFRQVGQSGAWMSELWQHLPKVADDICMLNSLCETNVAHGGACMKLHTGNESLLRPSLGSWVSYGLGTENRNLPSFVTICPTSLHGGVDNFGAAFLPGEHQGVALGTQGYPNTLAKNARFHYVEANSPKDRSVQELQLRLLNQLQTQKTMQLEGKREKRNTRKVQNRSRKKMKNERQTRRKILSKGRRPAAERWALGREELGPELGP